MVKKISFDFKLSINPFSKMQFIACAAENFMAPPSSTRERGRGRERERERERERKAAGMGEGGGGINWEIGVDTYTLLYI